MGWVRCCGRKGLFEGSRLLRGQLGSRQWVEVGRMFARGVSLETGGGQLRFGLSVGLYFAGMRGTDVLSHWQLYQLVMES